MASIYMRIDGLDNIKGAATIGDIGRQERFLCYRHHELGCKPRVCERGCGQRKQRRQRHGISGCSVGYA